MYQKSRIISTPISNNRLNFDERRNQTIVVPSLIEGTLEDVITGEEIVIEGEVSGKIIAGKGLKHFIYLKNSRVPTWIMDNHNHAFAFWHEAFWKGYTQKGSLLVHIDQHTDLATPSALPMKREKIKNKKDGLGKNSPPLFSFISSFFSLQEVEDYTNSVLTIADFIVPALATGLIRDALMVTGEDQNGVGLFSWKEELIKKSSVFPLSSSLYPSIIVDIDLDYFSQGFDDEKTLATTKYWIEKADIITIATSPLFIGQEEALQILKKLESVLFAPPPRT